MKAGEDYIRVGCGAIIINDKREVLLLKRASDARTEPGQWSRPGGQVEFGESAADAAVREVKEEAGIEVEVIRQLEFTENVASDGSKHWIALGFLARHVSGEIENVEPHKHDEIRWFSLDALPDNLTDYTRNAIDIYLRTKK